LTFSWLQELAMQAGFEGLAVRRPITETAFPELLDKAVLDSEWESTPDCPHTLIVEARKPSRDANIGHAFS
jgi:hypothetical protein